MNKLLVILSLLALVCSSLALTQSLFSVNAAEYVYDGLVGQPSYTNAATTSDQIRNPSDVEFNSAGGFYVTDVNPTAGRILYYASAADRNASFILGAASFGESGSIVPASLGVYSRGGVDVSVFYSSRGTSYSRFSNITGQNIPNSGIQDIQGTTYGTGPNAIVTRFAGNTGVYLSLATQASTGNTYLADTGNHRIVVEGPNATLSSFPIDYYGTGVDGLNSSCNASVSTCFQNPSAVAVDCAGGVWTSVSSATNATGPGILYFPPGQKIASAIYYPNITTGAPLSSIGVIYSINFNSACTRMSVAATYRILVASVVIPPYLQGVTLTVPTISNAVILGLASNNGQVPIPGTTTNSLSSTLQAATFVPGQTGATDRLVIADSLHNRLVFTSFQLAPTQNVSATASPSAQSVSASPVTASRSANSSVIVIPSLASNSPSVSSSGTNASRTAAASSVSALPSSASTLANATASASPVSASATPSAVSPSTTSTTSATSTTTATPSGSMSFGFTFSGSPSPVSFSPTSSSSSSSSFVPAIPASASTTPSGSGSRIFSWMKFF